LDTFELNSKVNEMLKQVKVVSSGENIELNKRKLPQYNDNLDTYLYGYKEPDKIPLGKISLKLFNEMIKESNDKKMDNNLLSNKYKLDKNLIDTLLIYYKPFQALSEKDLNNTQHKQQQQQQQQQRIFIKSTELLNAPETTKPNKL
jgi:hypothetical protein